MITLGDTKSVLATADPGILLKRGDVDGGMGKQGQAVAEVGPEAF